MGVYPINLRKEVLNLVLFASTIVWWWWLYAGQPKLCRPSQLLVEVCSQSHSYIFNCFRSQVAFKLCIFPNNSRACIPDYAYRNSSCTMLIILKSERASWWKGYNVYVSPRKNIFLEIRNFYRSGVSGIIDTLTTCSIRAPSKHSSTSYLI